MAVDPFLLHLWLTGWARARNLSAPVADGDGWRIDVHLPDQVARHVFAGASPSLARLAHQVTAPLIFLKACIPVEEMRRLLPPHWTVQAPRRMMLLQQSMPPATLADGYTLQRISELGVPAVRIFAADGKVAASGRVVPLAGFAIFDSIVTQAPHRRRGLGRMLMTALQDMAGPRQGLLMATEDGHALYAALGWRVISPYASAVIEYPPVKSGGRDPISVPGSQA